MRARRLIGKAAEIIAAKHDSDDAYLSLEVENLALQALEQALSHEESTA